MTITEAYKKLNTIYIISKGRPKCQTARVLTKKNYTGDWFIVCGNNDDKLEEYKKVWGDRVLVFDWFEEVKKTDFLDNLGFENYPSGAAPVRNATRRISFERGELRHWQLDDDYPGFIKFEKSQKKNVQIRSGSKLQFELAKLAKFAFEAGLANVGFQPTSNTYPDKAYFYSKRVFNAHNLPSEPDKFIKWRGRLNDDMINAIDVINQGKWAMAFNYLGMNMTKTQTEKGGNTELYIDHGTVMKTAYAIMMSPISVKLAIMFGRYHHQNQWTRISPKLLHEKYAKV